MDLSHLIERSASDQGLSFFHRPILRAPARSALSSTSLCATILVMPREKIIACGPLPDLSSAEYKRRFHELHRELKAKYAPETARASFLKRIVIWFRIQREVSGRLHPTPLSPHALYHIQSNG